jgi:hypothetical protein
MTIDCDQPMVFLGKGGKGTHIGKELTIQEAGTILSARGHMHVRILQSLLHDDSYTNLILRMGENRCIYISTIR